MSRYRAPAPETVDGAQRIAAPDVMALIKSKNPILIDAMPAEGGGLDPASGHWRIAKTHDTLPGAVWLPDVGKGAITPGIDAYFREKLARLTDGDKTRPVVIFCQADCWMSWNAVKRASAYGYSQLYWFAEGTDGWRDWDGSFVKAKPEPWRPAARP